MKITPYESTRLPTYDIDLEAPPETRWKHVAQKEAKNIGRLLDDCVELCVEQADCYPAYIRPLVVAAGKGLAVLSYDSSNSSAGMRRTGKKTAASFRTRSCNGSWSTSTFTCITTSVSRKGPRSSVAHPAALRESSPRRKG